MSTRLLSSWPQHLHSCLILDCSLQFLKWRCFLFFLFEPLASIGKTFEGSETSEALVWARWDSLKVSTHPFLQQLLLCLRWEAQHVKDAVQKTNPSSAGSGRRRNKERLCIWHGICRHRWRKIVLGKQRSPSRSQHNVAVCGTTSNTPLMPIKTAVSENNQGN